MAFPGPLSPDVREDPYPCYRWLLRERPVYHDPEAGYWALSRYADVVAAARDYATFSSAQGVGITRSKGRTIMSTDPPDHTRLRKLVTRAFQPAVVEALAPRVEAICHELIDASAAARGTFDLIEDFAFPLPVIVISELLGLDPDRREDYRRWSRTLVDMFSNPSSLTAQHQYAINAPQFFSYLGQIIEARRREPRADLISLLVQARDQHDALSLKEIASSCELFLAAGNETTTGLIGNAALALAAHPQEAEQVIRNPDLVPTMLEEVVRFDAPFQADFRTTTRAVTLHDVTIPNGAKVALLWAAANRDPETFREPDRLIASRSPNPHLGFGQGIHYCIGAPLARLEARVAAKVLSVRFRRLRPDAARSPVRNVISPFLRGLKQLPMSFALN